MNQSIQWFPGHMAGTKRQLKSFIDRAELVIHAIDARAPASTFSKALASSRQKVAIYFSKTDLADPSITKRWESWFKENGLFYFSSTSLEQFKRGASPVLGKSPIHAIVTGLPNVGKSTLINRLIGRKKTKTGALPGITRGPQWIKVSGSFYLLDNPGVFFPQNLPLQKSWRLAAVGTIPQENYYDQSVEICKQLVTYANQQYGVLSEAADHFHLYLETFGEKQGFLSKGGRVKEEEIAQRLIRNFQKGKWGRISLEEPE